MEVAEGVSKGTSEVAFTLQHFRRENAKLQFLFVCLLILEYWKVEHNENRLKSGAFKKKMPYL